MATTTTTIHVHNNVSKPTANVVLLFLQPVQAEDNYVYSAWNVLNPSIGSNQECVLETSFSASIAEFNSKVGDYSDPVPVTLGSAGLITNPNGQSPAIVGTSTQPITPDQVGLDNECVSPGTELSVSWYVNGNRVVQTNNTESSTLNLGFVSTFQLTQSVWLMFGQEPLITTTYVAQTFSAATPFPIQNGTADLYIEAYTDPTGRDSFKVVSPEDFAALAQQPELASTV